MPGQPAAGEEEGVWIDADPREGCLVVNVGELRASLYHLRVRAELFSLSFHAGEMVEEWTNGLYRSTLHRVIHRSENYRCVVSPSFPLFSRPERLTFSSFSSFSSLPPSLQSLDPLLLRTLLRLARRASPRRSPSASSRRRKPPWEEVRRSSLRRLPHEEGWRELCCWWEEGEVLRGRGGALRKMGDGVVERMLAVLKLMTFLSTLSRHLDR